MSEQKELIITEDNPCGTLVTCEECGGASDVKVRLWFDTQPTTAVDVFFLNTEQYKDIEEGDGCDKPSDYIDYLDKKQSFGKATVDLGEALSDESSSSKAPYVYVHGASNVDQDIKILYEIEYEATKGSSKLGLIIGIAVGAVVVTSAILMLFLCYWRQKQDEAFYGEDRDHSESEWDDVRDDDDFETGESIDESMPKDHREGARVRNNVMWIDRSGTETRNPLAV